MADATDTKLRNIERELHETKLLLTALIEASGLTEQVAQIEQARKDEQDRMAVAQAEAMSQAYER